MKLLMTISFSILTLALTPGCMTKRASLNGVPLTWQPTNDLKEVSMSELSKVSQASLKVEKFVDARTVQPKARIGEYSENEDNVLYVETSSDVGEFVTNGMKDYLKKAGLKLVDANPQYTLSGEVRDLYVTEKNTYQGRSLIHMTLKKGSKVVWEGQIRGKNSRFGRTYKLTNYMESLSDSVADTTIGLLNNEAFQKSF